MDTVYGFNSNTGNAGRSLVASHDKPQFEVDDRQGNDTFDFSGFRQNQVINLEAGAYSSVGGKPNNVYISPASVIENAIGGSGNDRIIGNEANNVLVGGEGADTLRGAGGRNVFKYNSVADSGYAAADLLIDFKTGWDKIDLCTLANTAGVSLNCVADFTGKPGDTVIKYNMYSGRYFLAIDLSGNGRSDFLIKSTRPISPDDVLGLA
ncbi:MULTISPECIES: M10 family metallopeptidase C-terminal domain-containing protein [Pseudomonas]|uniref:AprA_5 protein n=2 Tax=Pseudomonas TaxID=286 RepID=A0A0D0S7K0_PSEFL|nr:MULTISPECIES: M10 family metallopeptidase C-terminal domain-containing protein [Pseudomonas fluorescens group]KIR18378.1 Serralysin precursor [Pseudomonas fluorescens]